MERLNTGWRRSAPVAPIALSEESDTDRTDLFHAAHLAVQALDLKPACRYVLDQLVGCYRGEPVGGRLLVWPSNEFLEQRTGLSERTIRYVVAALLSAGVLSAKDSANGKRFAIRSKAGQIVDAYGLDLSPLLARRQEFANKVAVLKAELERRRRLFDEITISRRAAEEALRSIEEWFPEIDTGAHQSAIERLRSLTPRRTSIQAPDAAADAWRALRTTIESEFHAACAGKNSRLIENNNDSPDQSCNKAQRGDGGQNSAPLSLTDLLSACPDAVGYTEGIANERELVGAAAKLRGFVGIHESAWDEAREKLGPVMAAAAFMIVLQRYDRDQAGAQQIKNPGGYFRSYIRMIADGRVDLREEIAAMRRRRAH
ncbi:plasmid replication protein RepC [Mesorhizobium sp.]|uniref:plasmid replication protein RepC n=1 Tax=Mesorhizobium sp. TaxID=1871066 RepID=UPI000FE91AD9|nr:plasmid replication protein RepC [Mesorhizobium sp.]RWI35453.1 MAG: replication protein C [Mesorhizobium sp.]RWJ66378.1 MAG: replication protein C [Mesorhizobium sp.]